MRATSVIFLVLSIILAFIGVVLCGIGASLAEEQGIALFDEVTDANDNLVYTYNYAGDGIKKIAVDVGDCDIHVYGKSETAYVELINFAQGSYDLSSTNLTLSVTDNSSLLKIFSWGSEGINFHGFRHYLKAMDFSDKPRTINIYLTTDTAVKQFSLKTGEGDLTLKDLRFTFDFTGEVGKGNISLENMITTSDILLKVDEGSVNAANFTARALSIEAGNADVKLDSIYTLRGLTVNVARGNAYIDTLRQDYDDYNINLQAPKGKITYFGEAKGDSYTVTASEEETYEYILNVNADEGDVAISYTPAEDEEDE